jgi:hypothetical protein
LQRRAKAEAKPSEFRVQGHDKSKVKQLARSAGQVAFAFDLNERGSRPFAPFPATSDR